MKKAFRFLSVFIWVAMFFALPAPSYASPITAKSYVDAQVSTRVATADIASIIAGNITGKEDVVNKLKSVAGGGTGITSAATDIQYPSAKAVYAELATKANDADVVKLTGNQTIAGNKTFTGVTTVPTPTMPQ